MINLTATQQCVLHTMIADSAQLWAVPNGHGQTFYFIDDEPIVLSDAELADLVAGGYVVKSGDSMGKGWRGDVIVYETCYTVMDTARAIVGATSKESAQ